MNEIRGDESLRRGRWSEKGAWYFVTLCVEGRALGLTMDALALVVRDEIGACEKAAHWRVAAAVIMPDHLHMLIELTGALPLSRIVARVKAKTGSSLRTKGLGWQGNFYEHRLRS